MWHNTQLKPLPLKGVSVANMVLNVLVFLWHLNKGISVLDERSRVPWFSFKINLDLLLSENPSEEYCNMCQSRSHFTSSQNASWRFLLWITSSLPPPPPLLVNICFPEIFLKLSCFFLIFLSGVLWDHFVSPTFDLITTCSMKCWCWSWTFETWTQI